MRALPFSSPCFPPCSAGPHEGCHVSAVGLRVGLELLTGADAQRALGPRDRQGVQQHPPQPAAAGGGHAGQLQAPRLLGVHRDRGRGGESVSVAVSRGPSEGREVAMCPRTQDSSQGLKPEERSIFFVVVKCLKHS